MERKEHLLESRIEQYINEQFEGRLLSVEEAATSHLHLIGSWTPPIHIGYLRFLKALGIPSPTMSELNGHYIGRYWEYLAQHQGTLAAEKAMEVLHSFWTWCKTSEYIKPQKTPGDFGGPKTAHPYQLKIKILETL